MPSGLATQWTRILKIGAVVVLLMGVALATYNLIKATYPNRKISRFFPNQWIHLDEETSPAADAHDPDIEKKVFRVAIAPIVAPEKSLEMYQDFIDYVAEKLGRKPVSLYRPTYSETNDVVRYRRCDIAIVCTYPFIRGEREFGMQALVVPRIKGATTYQSFILVPASSPAQSLFDLRGKRFGSADIISTTGWLYPAMTLMEAGEDPNHFFGQHVLTGSHDRSIQAILDGFVDGAAVHGIVYNQMVSKDPSILTKMKILSKSSPFGIQPIVVHPDMDKNLRKEVLSVLLDMHKDARSKLILDKLQIERFVIPERGLFDKLRQAVSKLEGWK